MPVRPSRAGRSEPGVDLYRGIVVVLMFVVHARRLQETAGEGGADRVLDACMWMEPFIAASFLYVAGYSLVLSRTAWSHDGGWFGMVARRALVLYALSVALFVPHYGLELPDLVVSSGILSAIALSIVASAACLSLPHPSLALIVLAAVVLNATALLDHEQVTVPGLNAGPGGAFPLVAVTALGAVTALLYQRARLTGLATAVVACAPLTGIVLGTEAAWTTTRVSLYAHHSGQVALTSLLEPGAARIPVSFWNHTTAGALALLLPLSATLFALLIRQHALAKLVWLDPLITIGRHALVVYVMHLGLLGLAALAGVTPPSAGYTFALVVSLSAVGYAVARGLDELRARRRTRRPDNSEPAPVTPSQ